MVRFLLFAVLSLLLCLSYGYRVDVGKNLILPGSSEENDNLTVFECGEDGVYTNPRSCESYNRCSYHLKYTIPCDRGLHFNNATGRCTQQCDAHCDQSLACECGWSTCLLSCEEPNGTFPYPDDCEKFVTCINNKARLIKCPSGKAFNQNSKMCKRKRSTDCL